MKDLSKNSQFYYDLLIKSVNNLVDNPVFRSEIIRLIDELTETLLEEKCCYERNQRTK